MIKITLLLFLTGLLFRCADYISPTGTSIPPPRVRHFSKVIFQINDFVGEHGLWHLKDSGAVEYYWRPNGRTDTSTYTKTWFHSVPATVAVFIDTFDFYSLDVRFKFTTSITRTWSWDGIYDSLRHPGDTIQIFPDMADAY